jgi:Pyrimidine dimer DNA glycosylase
MQTFLPYQDFEASALALDYRRHGNQRNEALGIIYIASRHSGKDVREELKISAVYAMRLWNRYYHHPAVLMWVGYEQCLRHYYNTVVNTWISRKYRNNMSILHVEHDIRKPLWLGDERFHSSHRANLLRKNPQYYSQHGWTEDPEAPYFWPTKEGYQWR